MQILHSIKRIEKRYNTGEEPVLVACNDHNSYICKYPRYSGSANKLACELLGAELASTWNIDTPEIAFVKILATHVPQDMSGSLIDTRWTDNVRENFKETLNTILDNE